MRLWKRNRGESDAELDARMLRSRARFIDHYNATFGFEEGLDEIFERAGLARPQRRSRPAGRPGANG